ncbi:DUF502 domain-containing protein [Ginsengibacter hankyongi]|uniref:DUF502 domain-containing protein n=1 Tax=Ginsengibacter hankyongi TaxID=2607284 RepID=A0A5J5IMN1_9BACT|nr:DUF502 domain-containing protein [Ginsengibacter hankyongi]KAA9042209.1 DUF502 domain-containing protein [Ginsengibacter hankyongi]
MPQSVRYQRLIQYFLQGLLILGPVSITIYFIYEIFDKIDNILRPAINIPGIGFVIIIGFIITIGYLSSFFVMGRILSVMDKLLERTPGIKLFYSFVRDFFEAFAGNKKKFTNSVLANVDDTDVWRVGFITQEDMSGFGMENYVAVYLPMAYSVAGNVYIVPKERVKPITNISATQSMKFAVSGGVTETGSESPGDELSA